jgi:hypothetical protein
MFKNSSNIKFHENLSSESRVVPWLKTDILDEASSRFSQLLRSSVISHLRLGLPMVSFRQARPPKSYINFSSPPCMLHVPSNSSTFIWSACECFMKNIHHKAPHYAVNPDSCYPSSLSGSNIFLSTIFSNRYQYSSVLYLIL